MRMPSTLETSPAAVIDRKGIIDRAFEQTEQQALDEAAKGQLKVAAVKDIQKKKIEELMLSNAKGSDGAAAMVEDVSVQGLQKEVEKKAEDADAERMKAIDPTADAYVLDSKDATAGLQHDNTRKVGIAARVLKDKNLSRRVALHEGKHREQEEGDMTATLPPTGDPVIDRQRGKIRRLAFREKQSVDAEGGLNGHTQEYHEFVATTESVAKFLDSQGHNGKELAEKAADTNEGFREMQEAVQIAAIQKSLKEGRGMPEFSVN